MDTTAFKRAQSLMLIDLYVGHVRKACSSLARYLYMAHIVKEGGRDL